MKINEIIRKKRTEKGYTQEQMASLLGVSAPAVNKWENAVSYPDITLLPALARLLDTDLNTLLSFQDDLTKEEIDAFLNELVSAADNKGIDTAFHMASDKLHEYPSCDILLLNAALTLEGLITMALAADTYNEYKDRICQMYERASTSHDPQVSNLAKAMLISKYIVKKEFDSAEKLLDELPDEMKINKIQLQSVLYQEQGKWEQAAQLIERKILSEISGVQSSLLALAEIAVREDHLSDARQLTDIARQTAHLFHLWKCNADIADFELAVIQEDVTGCLNALKKILPALEQPWKPDDSPLYRHLPLRETDLGQRMLPGFISQLEDPENPSYNFLRKDQKVQELLKKYHASIAPDGV